MLDEVVEEGAPSAVVLLVDDQRIVAEAVRFILTPAAGFHLESCTDPKKAVDHALLLKPNVILLDVVMPHVDGMTMLRFFKLHPDLRNIPVVMLSGKDDPEGKAEAFENGASDYMVKLPHQTELVARVRYHCDAHLRLVERNQAVQALEESQQNLKISNQQLLEVITSLVDTQRHVERLAHLQELILGSAQDGIFSLNPEGHCTLINPAALRMLSYTAEELTEIHMHHVVHPDSAHTAEACPLVQCLDTRETTSSNDVFVGRDGRCISVEYSCAPIVETGHMDGVVVVFRDISVRCELERLQEEFIATVSHELRTPLTSISGCLGLVHAGFFGQLDGKGQRMLDVAMQNTHRLVKLLNDVLDIERLRAGRMPLAPTAIQVQDLVKTAIDELSTVAEQQAVTLVADSCDDVVQGDPDRVLQVLTNLLSNAIKFSKPQSSVTLKVERKLQDMMFSVSDHGRGIPEDRLAVIFDRFEQIEPSDARDKGGTGLGLAICRAIVEQHGGHIWVDSIYGEGSTFTFALPLGANSH